MATTSAVAVAAVVTMIAAAVANYQRLIHTNDGRDIEVPAVRLL